MTTSNNTKYLNNILDGQAPTEAPASYQEVLHGAITDIEGTVRAYEEDILAIDSAVEDMLAEFDAGQTKLVELRAEREKVKDKNAELDHRIALENLSNEQNKSRWNKEHGVYSFLNIGIEIAGGVLNPVDGVKKTLGWVFKKGVEGFVKGAPRSAGYKASELNERDYKNRAIALIEDRKIDTSQYPNAISRIEERLAEIQELEPAKRIQRDAAAYERLQRGVFNQRVILAGYEVGSVIEEEFLPKHGFETINDWLGAFRLAGFTEDEVEPSFAGPETSYTPKDKLQQKLYNAVVSLVHGGADTNDLTLILDTCNALQQSKAKVLTTKEGNIKRGPHLDALVEYVETVIKEDPGYFISKASIIDVARDAGMLSVNDNEVSLEPGTELADTIAEQKRIEAVVMGMLADQLDGAHRVGNYDMRRFFRDRHTRHGANLITVSELTGGNILFDGPGIAPKRVSLIEPGVLEQFNDVVKIKYETRDQDVPKLNDPFIRLCVHEYFLPQSVNAGDIDSDFESSPEVPAGYSIIDETVDRFLSQIADGDPVEFLNALGTHEHRVLAQAFFDYFADLGRRHRDMTLEERGKLREAFGSATYPTRYSTYQRRLRSALQDPEEFGLFTAAYDENAAAYIRTAKTAVKPSALAALKAVSALGVPKVLSGSKAALLETLETERRLENMSEPLDLTGLGEERRKHIAAAEKLAQKAQRAARLHEAKNKKRRIARRKATTKKRKAELERTKLPFPIATFVPEKGVYAGIWEPVDPTTGERVGTHSFDIYTTQTEVWVDKDGQPKAQISSYLEESDVFALEEAVNVVAKISNMHGHDGTRIEDEETLLRNIRWGEYNELERWFIPPHKIIAKNFCNLHYTIVPGPLVYTPILRFRKKSVIWSKGGLSVPVKRTVDAHYLSISRGRFYFDTSEFASRRDEVMDKYFRRIHRKERVDEKEYLLRPVRAEVRAPSP